MHGAGVDRVHPGAGHARTEHRCVGSSRSHTRDARRLREAARKPNPPNTEFGTREAGPAPLNSDPKHPDDSSVVFFLLPLLLAGPQVPMERRIERAASVYLICAAGRAGQPCWQQSNRPSRPSTSMSRFALHGTARHSRSSPWRSNNAFRANDDATVCCSAMHVTVDCGRSGACFLCFPELLYQSVHDSHSILVARSKASS
jgi:hypothetical protein